MKKTFLFLAVVLLVAVAVIACTQGSTTPAVTDDTQATEDAMGALTEQATSAAEPDTSASTETADASTDAGEATDAETVASTEAATVKPNQPAEEETDAPYDPNAPIFIVDAEAIAAKANTPDDPFSANHIAFAATMTEGSHTFARIAACGDDPHIVFIPLQSDMYLTNYLVISYRNNSRFPGEFYMGSGGGWTGIGDNFNANWTTDNEWDLMIVDLSTTGMTSIVDDIITYARIDIFRGESTEDEWFDLEFIAFFESPEQAIAYYEARHGEMTKEPNNNSVETPMPELPEGDNSGNNTPEDETDAPETDAPASKPEDDTSPVTFGDSVSTVTLVSAEVVYLYNGDTLVETKSADWLRQNQGKISLGANVTHIAFEGWANPIDGIEIASYGYQIDDNTPVFNLGFSGIPGDPDSSALQGALGDSNAVRYLIKIPVTEGTHTFDLLVKDTNSVAYEIGYWWTTAMTFEKASA